MSAGISKAHLLKGIFPLEISGLVITSEEHTGIFVRNNFVHYNCNKTRTYLYTIWF
jgi:hypothetical protein